MRFYKLYYRIKPVIPRGLQLYLRRRVVSRQRALSAGVWPIDERAAARPEGWKGWPEGKTFALVLTHDVDTARGQGRCALLSEAEEALGLRSSFNFVPERYAVSPTLRAGLASRGFEVGVHGLNHDGRLYCTEEVFAKRAKRINGYIKDWSAAGFRSPAMHHNLDWLRRLDIEYDASTFDTDPFEPQSDGVRTIFPFIVEGKDGREGYVEMPYTLAQDFTLFVMMRERGVDIWKEKLRWIAGHGGMALMNTHPDYMSFSGQRTGREEYPAEYYLEFLDYVKREFKGAFWHALPRDVARHYAKGHGKDRPA